MTDPLVEAWQTHARLSLRYAEAIDEEALASKAPSMGRTVGQILAHMHNNRLSWLEHLAPDLFTGLEKIDQEDANGRASLLSALDASAQAVEQLLQRSMEAGGDLKGFRGHAASFVGYLIAHDSYHHGEIGMSLTQTGYRPDRRTAYSLWDWRRPKSTS